ncbi:MAG: Ubiquinone biosynthesis O-methyltransferase [Cyanobacteriota bacterium]|jgi:2-polyprenyl-3-methyl-5-hydroxy-6-metoxy-1,4-benzoquinol methylase
MSIQPLEELEQIYQKKNLWLYEPNPDDVRRKAILLSELPSLSYQTVLNIGCGYGFITRDLPGNSILGVDVSANAISQANIWLQESPVRNKQIQFLQSSIFDLQNCLGSTYDLIVITGVLYPHYIGESKTLIYQIIDRFLKEDGILLNCHINDWLTARFPYLLLESYFFSYGEYTQRLEVYVK